MLSYSSRNQGVTILKLGPNRLFWVLFFTLCIQYHYHLLWKKCKSLKFRYDELQIHVGLEETTRAVLYNQTRKQTELILSSVKLSAIYMGPESVYDFAESLKVSFERLRDKGLASAVFTASSVP